jgi:predicted Zn-dependent peptidase
MPSPLHPSPQLTTLANGARIVALPMPARETVAVSVFVRTGSQHESRRQAGISHVVEHMAFKGTTHRDCQRINLDAESLGAEVNAHTDKDHTAFHIDGLARDAGAFVRMLGDIVLNSTFPAAELERERQVILHELAEDEDDPLSTAFKLFDEACWGAHACARPVIGLKANIQRFTRDELQAFVHQQYSGANVVIGVAGGFDGDAVLRACAQTFAAMPAGTPNTVPPPDWVGGMKSRALSGSSQTHVVLGFPMPSLAGDPLPEVLAAALLGEGMSSPLLDEIRERRGLAYYLACSADVRESHGQFVIEASTAPAQAEALLAEMLRLLAAQAAQCDAAGLERARNQLFVRSLRDEERASRRIETAALDLFARGQLRDTARWRERLHEITPSQVREAFVRLLSVPPALALAGSVGPRLRERAGNLLTSFGHGTPALRTAA